MNVPKTTSRQEVQLRRRINHVGATSWSKQSTLVNLFIQKAGEIQPMKAKRIH